MNATPRIADQDLASDLDRLRADILKMAGRVESMIAAGSRALVFGDVDGARAVMTVDVEVDTAEIEIDELCIRVLELRQPTGSELRFLMSTMKMVTDLERIGDLTVNVAERAIDLAQGPRVPVHPGIDGMAKIARAMVAGAIDSFVDRDAARARNVIAMDDEIDRLYTSVFSGVLETMLCDPSLVHAGIHVQSVAKYLERIGDHATNLAEQVVFMVEGEDIRHTGRDESG